MKKPKCKYCRINLVNEGRIYGCSRCGAAYSKKTKKEIDAGCYGTGVYMEIRGNFEG